MAIPLAAWLWHDAHLVCLPALYLVGFRSKSLPATVERRRSFRPGSAGLHKLIWVLLVRGRHNRADDVKNGSDFLIGVPNRSGG